MAAKAMVFPVVSCPLLTVVYRDIADWLMDKYPESMEVRDNVSTQTGQNSRGQGVIW